MKRPATLWLIFLMASLVAPGLAPYDPFAISPESMLQPPTFEHWFGTDQLGRDLLSRVLVGARETLIFAIGSVALATVCGSLLGLVAGYYGGIVDSAISRLFDTLFAFPDILIALALIAILGPGTGKLVIAVGVVYMPVFGRLVRSLVQDLRGRPFVEAATAQGATPQRIMSRHVLPQTVAPVVAQINLSIGFAILAQAALSYLGLAGEPDSPSWGVTIRDGVQWMEQAWWIPVFPGAAIFVTVFSCQALRSKSETRRQG